MRIPGYKPGGKDLVLTAPLHGRFRATLDW